MTTKAKLVTAFTASLTFSALVACGSDVLKGMAGNVSLRESRTRLMLIKITQEPAPPDVGTKPQPIHPRTVSYRATAVCEIEGRVPAESSVWLDGRMNSYGSAPINIPEWTTGAYVLVAARTTDQPARFEFAGSLTLPVGLASPLIVGSTEVPELKAALSRLGQLLSREAPPTTDEIESFRQSKNFYLWALGEALLSNSGTAGAAKELWLDAREANGPISLRQGWWIETLFKQNFTQANLPPLEQRYEHLMDLVGRDAKGRIAAGGVVDGQVKR